MYICIDFDGTIVDHDFPDIGQPVPDALYWMKRWHFLGARLILYTMRSDDKDRHVLEDAIEYLRDAEIELYGANVNPDQASWSTSPKVYAHIYVDDAAFGCPLITIDGFKRACVDWTIVGPAIETILLLRNANKP